MSKSAEFWEYYNHPNWQRKRLEIMQRDEFTCVDCKSKEKKLNVHHAYYEKGKKPWEYPSETLHCLCEGCHEQRHKDKTMIAGNVALLDPLGVKRVIGYTLGELINARSNYSINIADADTAVGLADCYRFKSIDAEYAILYKQEELKKSSGKHCVLNMRIINSLRDTDEPDEDESLVKVTIKNLVDEHLSENRLRRLIGYAKAMSVASQPKDLGRVCIDDDDEADGFCDYFGIVNKYEIRKVTKLGPHKNATEKYFASINMSEVESVLANQETDREDAESIRDFPIGSL